MTTSIVEEKKDIADNSDSLIWLLDAYGSYYREEADMARLVRFYGNRSQLGIALVKRKRVVNQLITYIEKKIEKLNK